MIHSSQTALRDALDFWNVKGVVVAFVRRQDSQWVEEVHCAGTRNNEGEAVNAATQFFIASNSKLFCALLASHALQEAGYSMGLDTAIKDVIPEYELLEQPGADTITFADALSHCTGLPRHDHHASRDMRTLEQQLQVLQQLRPSLGVREGAQYHNLHYDLIALIIERITNRSYHEYMAQKILRPLGLDATTCVPEHVIANKNHAHGYWQQVDIARDGRTNKDPAIDLPCPMTSTSSVLMGAGKMASTGKDMARWVRILLETANVNNRGPGNVPADGSTEASAMQSLQRCMACSVPFDEYSKHDKYPQELGPAKYGLGLWEHTYRQEGRNEIIHVVEHIGSLPGWESRLCLLPDLHVGFFIATNGSPWGALLHEEIKYDILDEILTSSDHTADGSACKTDWRARLAKERTQTILDHKAQNDKHISQHRTTQSGLVADQIIGTYASPGFPHIWNIEHQHILNDPPKNLSEIPNLPYIWGDKIQPYLWHRNSREYGMCWEVQFREGIAAPTLLGLALDLELDVDEGSGEVQGFGVWGIWGAGRGITSTREGSVQQRAEMYFSRTVLE